MHLFLVKHRPNVVVALIGYSKENLKIHRGPLPSLPSLPSPPSPSSPPLPSPPSLLALPSYIPLTLEVGPLKSS